METKSHSDGLGIIGWDSFEYVVADLERARRFYRDKMDIPELGRMEERWGRDRGEEGLLFRAGSINFSCVASAEKGSRAERWLRRHPEGVSTLALRVRDAARARQVLEGRGATLTGPLTEEMDQEERPVRSFEIASPLGEVRFRFVERPTDAFPVHFTATEGSGAHNRHRYQVIDHVTSNLLTLEPWVTWLRDVLGFEEYWRVSFHTSDGKKDEGGTGLSSIVMKDPDSDVKLANNEPQSPNYGASQIYRFVEDNRGPGVQHVAFHVPDILACTGELRRAGVDFLDTPGSYYDMLPKRMEERHITNFREDLDTLRRLGILVDGENDKYLLQIFSVEGKLLQDDEMGGPFFYELIQRRGARGFGEGNFRALFEAIEREQETRGTLAAPHAWAGSK